MYRCDLRDRLPVRSGTAPAVLAEHVLEHLFLDELPPVLLEVKRVLRPGGSFRVVSPDARYIASLILDGDSPEYAEAIHRDAQMHRWNRQPDPLTNLINRLSHQWGQHRALLTPRSVASLLEQAGFVEITQLDSVESTEHFDRIPDVHPIAFPDDPEGMNFAVEARRPE